MPRDLRPDPPHARPPLAHLLPSQRTPVAPDACPRCLTIGAPDGRPQHRKGRVIQMLRCPKCAHRFAHKPA